MVFSSPSRPDYRALVKREFEGIQALQSEYIAALEKPYQVPKVPDPR